MSTIDLPTQSSQEAVKNVIESELNTDKFTTNFTYGSKLGDNYIGVIYRVTATKTVCNESKNDDKESSVSVILKVPPKNPARREQFFAGPCFLRETLVYNEILPMFRNFQQSKGINILNGFYEIPRCLYTCDLEFEEILIFEDLQHLGFEMFDRHSEVTFPHAVLVMRVLGKLHAISYGLRDQNFERLSPYRKIVDLFTVRKNSSLLQQYINMQVEKAKSTLNTDDSELLAKLSDIFSNGAMKVILECVNGELAEPYSVFCHGDCWNNNLLFRSEHNVPVDIRLLDWQITRWASPACDLVYYMFCSTSKTFRDTHYEDLLAEYYKSLCDHMIRTGSDPAKMFPKAELNRQLQKFGKFGLVMAIMVLPMFMSEVEDLPDMDHACETISNDPKMGAEIFKFERTHSRYAIRMRDIIIDMDRLGYI